MSEFMSYDPWANITTRNGFPGDEIVSMLQKSIRKGKEENAIKAAYEMYITSPQFEDKLWRRLMAISVEDIGFGDTEACRYVYTLNQIRKEFLYADGDRCLFFIQAIRYLCRCKKERSSDHIKCKLMTEFEHGKTFEVPDYAYDMHTQKGREMGRDVVHFLEEASAVTPELENEEFKKIKVDLNYGLDYDVVFNRFAKRLNIEEAYYMSTSLIILNKTGGNISKIFTTIEKSFFDRKKLKDELSSAIAVSELVFKILVFIPIFIFLVIFIIL